MTDDEFSDAATKMVRMLLDNPAGTAHGLRILLDKAGKTPADLYLYGNPPAAAAARDRALAAEDAITLNWSSLASLAASRGYTTDREIAAALGAPIALIRDLKKSGYVPRKFMLRMAEMRENPSPRVIPDKSEIDALMRSHLRKPHRYGHFVSWASKLMKQAAGKKRISYLTIVSAIRNSGVPINDHLGLLYTKVYEHEFPQHANKITQRHGGQTRRWEADWTPERADEVLRVYHEWKDAEDEAATKTLRAMQKPTQEDNGDERDGIQN